MRFPRPSLPLHVYDDLQCGGGGRGGGCQWMRLGTEELMGGCSNWQADLLIGFT